MAVDCTAPSCCNNEFWYSILTFFFQIKIIWMLLIVVLSIGFKDKTISNRFTGFFLPSFADGAKQSAVTFFVLFFYYFSFYFFF